MVISHYLKPLFKLSLILLHIYFWKVSGMNCIGQLFERPSFQSLSLDPRSPSGIPRSPILVEDAATPGSGRDPAGDTTPKTGSGKKKGPKRGMMAKAAKLLPASKLSFEPIPNNEDEADGRKEEVEEKDESSVVEIEQEAKVRRRPADFLWNAPN